MGIPADSKRIKRSNLSYANTNRSSELFKGVFEKLIGEARGVKSPLYSIDSAAIDLRLKLYLRTDFRKGKAGIKPAAELDHQGKIPSAVFTGLQSDRKIPDKYETLPSRYYAEF